MLTSPRKETGSSSSQTTPLENTISAWKKKRLKVLGGSTRLVSSGSLRCSLPPVGPGIGKKRKYLLEVALLAGPPGGDRW